MSIKHYKQLDKKDCAPTCLKIIAKYYGKTIKVQYLRQITNGDRDGVSIKALAEAAKKNTS